MRSILPFSGAALCFYATLLMITVHPTSSLAATFIVNSTSDLVDAAPGDGSCAAAGGTCTLRAAVREANALAGDDSITLPSGNYILSLGSDGEDAAAQGDLDVTSNLTINGAGTNLTAVNGNANDRVFHIDPSGTGITVQISDLTVRNGDVFASAENGGGIFNQGGNLTLNRVAVVDNICFGDGGGIRNENQSSLTINDSVIQANRASINGAGIDNRDSILNITNCEISFNQITDSCCNGGGIDSEDGNPVVTIDRSVISYNSAGSNGGGIYLSGPVQVTITDSSISHNIAGSDGVGTGGGLRAGGSSNTTLTNTTISGNSAYGQGGGIEANSILSLTNVTISGNRSLGDGGGITVGSSANLTITNSTIAFNSADLDEDAGGDEGGGIENKNGGTVTLKNSLVAYNLLIEAADDCGGTTVITSSGNNLDSDGSCGLVMGTDQSGKDPLLQPLSDNGGAVNTHALFPGSPAIDTASNSGCPDKDARGFDRPADGNEDAAKTCDIGAFEFGVDCNSNGIGDIDDIAAGTSGDCDTNGIPDECQEDGDSDGTIDSCEACPADPNKTAAGVCGCAAPDDDGNENGIIDCLANQDLKLQIKKQKKLLKQLAAGKNTESSLKQVSEEIVSYVTDFLDQIVLIDPSVDLLKLAGAAKRKATRARKTALAADIAKALAANKKLNSKVAAA